MCLNVRVGRSEQLGLNARFRLRGVSRGGSRPPNGAGEVQGRVGTRSTRSSPV